MSRISKAGNVTAWVLCGLLGFVYVSTGLPKLGLFTEEMVTEVTENFRRYGHPDAFRIFIGVCEVAGAVGLLIPRLASLAALGLMAIMCGAIYTHATHGENLEMIGPLVLLGLLGITALLRRPRLIFGAERAADTGSGSGSEKRAPQNRSAA